MEYCLKASNFYMSKNWTAVNVNWWYEGFIDIVVWILYMHFVKNLKKKKTNLCRYLIEKIEY